MESILKKLKVILNGLSDRELEEFSLWINNDSTIDAIIFEEDSISLVTDSSKLKINDKQW